MDAYKKYAASYVNTECTVYEVETLHQVIFTFMRFPLPPAKNTTLTEPSGTSRLSCDFQNIGLCTWRFLASQLLTSPTAVPARALQLCSVLGSLTPFCDRRLDLPDRR